MANLVIAAAGSVFANALGPAMWTFAGSLGTTASTLGFIGGPAIGTPFAPSIAGAQSPLEAFANDEPACCVPP